MFKNYLKVALRNLVKQKIYSIITLFSLSIGITCCLLIMLYVKQELGYDNFYPNSDRIYRVAMKRIRPQGISLGAVTPTPLAPALKEECPEIEHITRVYFDDQVLFEYKNKRIIEDNVIFADPDFFNVFPFHILRGNPSYLLDTPQSVVLTASTAKKYFADEDPLGKVFRIYNTNNLKVTGVIEDVPVNSHFHFDFVVSFLAKNKENFGTWLDSWTGVTTLYTYVVLPEYINIKGFTQKVEDIITKHSGSRPNLTRKIFFQPLKSIHLHSHIEDEIEPSNFISNLLILSIIAFFMLIIACINYMNLASSQSTKRAREVGIRKVLGADRYQLIKQFIGESILLTLLAMLFSLVLAKMLLPTFSSLVGKSVDFIISKNLIFLAGFFLIAILIGIISSIYPAVILSHFQPVRVIKGLKDTAKSSKIQLFFKKGLVVIQFIVSILLIISTLVINQQLHYMRNAHLGFDKENIVMIPLLGNSRKHYKAVKQELTEYPDITAATACFRAPIDDYVLQTRAFPQGQKSGTDFFVKLNSVDFDYMDTFNIELVAGREFSREFSSDRENAFIVNEAVVRALGFPSPEDALGQEIRIGIGTKGAIIGVTKDYHISSFHEEIEPFITLYMPDLFVHMAVKIQSQNTSAALASIEKTWKKFIPDYPFTFSFLDEDIDSLYKGDEQVARIIRTFSFIAIFIACLGLLGLAAFTAERRTKEIGIRKVWGASIPHLVIMLSSEFSKWVLVANIIAWPVAYLAMNRWLQAFAYRINIGFLPFVLAAIIAFIIAWLTVSYHSIKAALVNPVEFLRYE